MFVKLLMFCEGVSEKHKEWAIRDSFDKAFCRYALLPDESTVKAKVWKTFTLVITIAIVTQCAQRSAS